MYPSDIPISEALDTVLVKETLSAPPFYQVDGLINVRSIPLPKPQGEGSRRGLILRSGETNHIAATGTSQLAALGITKIFDLRSPIESKKSTSAPLRIDGIDVVNVPALVISHTENLGLMISKFAEGGDDPFLWSYADILEEGAPAFKAIFEHVKDRLPLGEGCLIHCTAGKDRTGVAVMLILDLIGVDDEVIAKDYGLTRIGLESARETLLARFAKMWEEPGIAAGVINAFSSRPSAALAALKMLRETYGGAEDYLRKRAGFSEGDVERIRRSLRGEA